MFASSKKGKGEQIVDHIPRQLSRKAWHFLRHGGQATCEVIGTRKQGSSTVYIPLRSKETVYKEA